MQVHLDFRPPARLLQHSPFVPPHHAGLQAISLAAAWGETERHLDVPLDHFDKSNKLKQRLRYWVTDEAWSGDRNAPILLNVPGESAQNGPDFVPSWLEQYGALALTSEHRFFGSSVSTPDTSTANLKFLTVDQAAADLAALVDHVKAQRNLTGPVIAYGCSYPGALSSFVRTKYPAKVHAAIAASAPVQARTAFGGLDRSIALAIQRHSPTCLASVNRVFKAVDHLSKGGAEAKRALKEQFGMPSDASLPQGDFDLQYMLADTVANAVQTGSKSTLCTQVARIPEHAAPHEVVQLYSQSAKLLGSAFQNAYKSEDLKSPDKNSAIKDNRLWTWLQCHQLGYLQASNAAKNELDNPDPPAVTSRSTTLTTQQFQKNCEYLFPGAQLTSPARDAKFNSFYGGLEPGRHNISNVLYLKYEDDPWWSLQPSKEHAEKYANKLNVVMAADMHCAHCGMGCSESLQSQTEEAISKFLGSALKKTDASHLYKHERYYESSDENQQLNSLQPARLTK